MALSPINFSKIIQDIEDAGLSIQKISLLMHRQYTQIKRIKDTGRCQWHEGEMLLEIHRDVVKSPDALWWRVMPLQSTYIL